jgi:hypothetical protein
MTAFRRCLLTTPLLGLCAAAGAAPAAAQLDVSLSGGSGIYASSVYCLDSGAFVTVIEFGLGGDLLGGSAAYSNGSWPWMPPPGSGIAGALYSGVAAPAAAQQPVFLTHGAAFRGMVEAYPIGFLARASGRREGGSLRDFGQYVRPFIAAGLHVSRDGDPAPPGGGRNAETWGIKGAVSPLVSYGVRAFLPGRSSPVRIVVQYRGNTMFVSEVEYITPGGGTPPRRDGETVTWGEWGIGLSLGLGR